MARRLWGVSQIAAGVVGLVAPRRLATAAGGSESSVPEWLVRLLGGRMIGQGSLLLLRPTDQVLALGCATDALHGASMIVVAAVSPPYRRSALVASSVAGGSFLVGLRLRR